MRVVATSFGEAPGAQQIGVTEHRRGSAAGDDLARQQQRFRVLLTNMLEVVQDGDDGPPFAMPMPHQRRQVTNTGGVDGAVGLIEEEQRSILKQDASEVRTLQLTARERADRTPLEAVQANQIDRRGNALAPGPVETAKGANLAPQPHCHEVVNDHRKAAVERRQLGQISDLLALHTLHLKRDARCSLMLSQTGKGDPLAHPRLTLQARGRMLELRFPGRWLKDHPLTVADLRQEIELLRAVDFRLKVYSSRGVPAV